MLCHAPGTLRDLHPAGRPCRRDGYAPFSPHATEQPQLPHIPRELIMVIFISEGPGHPATASIDDINVEANPPQEYQARILGGEAQAGSRVVCFLMAVWVKQYAYVITGYAHTAEPVQTRQILFNRS